MAKTPFEVYRQQLLELRAAVSAAQGNSEAFQKTQKMIISFIDACLPFIGDNDWNISLRPWYAVSTIAQGKALSGQLSQLKHLVITDDDQAQLLGLLIDTIPHKVNRPPLPDMFGYEIEKMTADRLKDVIGTIETNLAAYVQAKAVRQAAAAGPADKQNEVGAATGAQAADIQTALEQYVNQAAALQITVTAIQEAFESNPKMDEAIQRSILDHLTRVNAEVQTIVQFCDASLPIAKAQFDVCKAKVTSGKAKVEQLEKQQKELAKYDAVINSATFPAYDAELAKLLGLSAEDDQKWQAELKHQAAVRAYYSSWAWQVGANVYNYLMSNPSSSAQVHASLKKKYVDRTAELATQHSAATTEQQQLLRESANAEKLVTNLEETAKQGKKVSNEISVTADVIKLSQVPAAPENPIDKLSNLGRLKEYAKDFYNIAKASMHGWRSVMASMGPTNKASILDVLARLTKLKFPERPFDTQHLARPVPPALQLVVTDEHRSRAAVTA